MHTTRTDERLGHRNMDDVSVRTVLAVQGKETIRVGVQKPAGIEDVIFSLICNAHNQRLSDAQLGIPPTRQAHQTLLRRLASCRAPYGNAGSDPIFWLFRVRWEIRQATLSFLNLRSASHTDRRPTTQAWQSKLPTRYKAMAAWSLGCWDRNEILDQVCRELFDEGLLGRDYVIPDYQTGHRIYWYAATRGFTRPQTTRIAYEAGILPSWRKEISSRRDHAKSVHYML